MLNEAIFEVLAPFSAYVRLLEIEGCDNLGPFKFHLLPQLDFGALQYLSLSDKEANHHDFMIHILNTMQKSGITTDTLCLSLHPRTFQPVLRHSVISKAIHLNVEAGKFSINGPYWSTEMFNRL
jgi:hypothetical protein